MITNIPGTALKYDRGSGVGAYSVIRPFFSVTNGMTLAQVRELTGLETSTIQNWVKRGWVAPPINKRYGEQTVVRIILINSVRRSMQIDMVIKLMEYINGDVVDTSDDVVSDGVLFDEFCKAVYRCDETCSYDSEVIDKIIAEQVGMIADLDDEGRFKLHKTLQIMVLAYLAAQIQDNLYEEYDNHVRSVVG